MSFRLDFAPHIGFPNPDMPLFGCLCGSDEPERNIMFAADAGFQRIQDPFAAQRSADAQRRIGDIAADAGLALGCFVYAPMERSSQPWWSVVDEPRRRQLDADLTEAIAIARRLGSRHIAVFTGTAEDRPKADQRHAMAANLARVAHRVAGEGMMLCVEAVNAKRLPQMLLHHFSESVAVVREADHPAVRLIFDFAHVQAMDGDILGQLDEAWDLIELIQLADHPGRVEPGAGELNFDLLLNALLDRGFAGPCELEHLWSQSGVKVQADYLAWLGQWKAGGASYRAPADPAFRTVAGHGMDKE